MEIKIAILDDEKVHLVNIKKIVEEYKTDKDVRGYEFLASEELLKSKEEFDIILVDMELNVVNEGLDTVRLYREQGRDAIIIFVTSHEEMVRDGYKVNAFEYVYKNNLDDELKNALGRAFEYLRKKKEIEVTVINQSKALVINCSGNVGPDIYFFVTVSLWSKKIYKSRVYTYYKSILCIFFDSDFGRGYASKNTWKVYAKCE